MPARRTTCFVRVYLDQKCELALPCDSPAHDLRAFPERSLVAFRLGDPWHAIRFVGRRAFYDCRPALGNGPEPDFRRLGSLADAADRIRSCARDSDCPVLGDPNSDPRITLRAAQLCRAPPEAPPKPPRAASKTR